ncbi:MAG TPA: hypothetical protein DCE55_06685 [Planctomycetaceae bacterium]|nr:hypothetical protein [Planctomycetaceae bacterium]
MFEISNENVLHPRNGPRHFAPIYQSLWYVLVRVRVFHSWSHAPKEWPFWKRPCAASGFVDKLYTNCGSRNGHPITSSMQSRKTCRMLQGNRFHGSQRARPGSD